MGDSEGCPESLCIIFDGNSVGLIAVGLRSFGGCLGPALVFVWGGALLGVALVAGIVWHLGTFLMSANFLRP